MTAPTSGSDPYAVLGVAPGTPFAEVKATYRRLVRELHPDVNPGARARFDAVQEAFRSLEAQSARPRGGARQAVPPEVAGGTGPFTTGSFNGTSFATGGIGPDTGRGSAPIREQPATASVGLSARAAAPTVEPPGTVRGTRPMEAPSPEKPATAPIPPESERAATPPPGRPRTAPIPSQTARAATARPDVASALRSQPAPAPAPAAPRPAAAANPALSVVLIPGRDQLLLQPRAQMLYVLLEFKLAEDVGTSTQPLNLALVLDHSSSMQRDDKLQKLKEAVSRIIDLMDPRDYLSLVTFGDRATILLKSGPLGTKRAAKEALDGIRCRGGTEISTGIRAGMEELRGHSANLISQMIVLTDGQTYGDEDLCLSLASDAGDQQVQVTALGLGDDWNSALLDEIASRTGGHADYVQSAEKLASAFEEQLRTLQLTALRNLRMTINTGISSRVLRATWVAPGIKPFAIPTEPGTTPGPLALDLGRVSTDRDYRLLVEFVVASRSTGHTDVAEIEFTYDVPNWGREGELIRYHLSTNFVERWDTEPPVDLRVHDALRKITAHRLQEQAMLAIQEGQTQKGTASLRTAAKHLEAAGCPELADLAKAEADRVERQGQAQAGNMKKIMYGTRKLG